ncbi:MAG: histidine kinase dimerization/phospho-acceptor domain-containing protein [Thermomicrobiales bacterium]
MNRLLGLVQRSIRTEIFVSQLLIVAIASLSVIVSTLFLAPRFSEDALRHLQGVGTSGEIDSTIITNTRTAIEETMFISTTVAVIIASIVAGTIAYLVARRIVEPVQQVSQLGERMAVGDYAIRVPITSEDEVGNLARSFNTLAATLESNEERRLRLLADVAHELRTPLATLHGNLEGLLDQVIEPDPVLWASLLRETRRLRQLVDDLHELSRADADQPVLNITSFDPLELVEQTIRGVRPQFDEKGVSLILSGAADLPMVQADEDRIATHDRAEQRTPVHAGRGQRHRCTPAGGAIPASNLRGS